MKSEFLQGSVREKLISGAKKAADLVKTTLGPKGKTVFIDSPSGVASMTKDGVTVAKNIEFEDKIENKGAQLVLSAAKKADAEAGDGTTTTTVLTNALLEQMNSIPESMYKRDVQNGIRRAKEEGLEFIKRHIKEVKHYEDIKDVASISANDREMGETTANAFVDDVNQIQKNSVVSIEEGHSVKTELIKKKGVEIDSGYISPYFINKPKELSCSLSKVNILITDQKITSHTGIIKLLDNNPRLSQESLLIIAEDVEGDALTALIVNSKYKGLKAAAIKAPGFGDRKKEIMEDLSILTGAKIYSAELGFDIDNIDIDDLGYADSINIKKDKSTLTGASGNEGDISNRCDIIRRELASTKSDYDKEKLEERLGALEGRISVISVGGDNEVDVSEKKDRYQDAVNSVKASILNGILPGGGVAFYRMSLMLKGVEFENPGEEFGKLILCNALEKVMFNIILNTGKADYEIYNIMSQLKEGDFDMGYDAHKGVICNMRDSKIIDAAKVVLDSLNAAISTSITILNASAIIYRDDTKDGDAQAPSAPGMF